MICLSKPREMLSNPSANHECVFSKNPTRQFRRRVRFSTDRIRRFEPRFIAIEKSCRIFREKALFSIEEIFLVQLDGKMRISAETTSVQRLLGPADVARWLGVSSGWVRDHATRKEPRLKSVKVGKLLRFRPEDIEDFLRTWSGVGEVPEQTTPAQRLQGVTTL
jgi:hypothetical protein